MNILIWNWSCITIYILEWFGKTSKYISRIISSTDDEVAHIISIFPMRFVYITTIRRLIYWVISSCIIVIWTIIIQYVFFYSFLPSFLARYFQFSPPIYTALINIQQNMHGQNSAINLCCVICLLVLHIVWAVSRMKEWYMYFLLNKWGEVQCHSLQTISVPMALVWIYFSASLIE